MFKARVCYSNRYGAEFKLDVGLYRLDQQVACQRYRQKPVIANITDRVAFIKDLASRLVPERGYVPVTA